MQETRKLILEILRERGQATVDDIVSELQARRGSITAVTVRHHLARLQEDELITMPELRRRATPGRPQYIYMLTDKAQDHFPNNYQRLAAGLLAQMREHLPAAGINVILEGVADQLAAELYIPDVPLAERLNIVTQYLSEHGYDARWETDERGYVLHTSNCPYHHLVSENAMLCEMDMRLIAALLGSVPRRLEHRAEGGDHCSYLITAAQ